MSNNNVKNGRLGLKSPKVIGAIVIVALICIIVLWLKVVRGSEQAGSDLVTFVAKRGHLTISVLESGTIKPRERIIIKNELEGRTSIISLISEGAKVKEGDLLVELDASTLEDALIDQEISVQNAEAAFIDANESLAVAENQAQSDIDVAKLTLTFAEQDLQQYKDGQYPKDLKTANNEITLRKEELTRARETLEWSQKLFEEKYLSNTDLQADKLAVTRSTNNLELANEELRLLGEYTRQRNIDQFESDFQQAKMALERTQRKARADVVQAKAALKAKKLEKTRQITKLEKINDQIGKAKVLSPAEGTVIYATSAQRGRRRDSQEPLDEGVEVHERQELIYLPTATSTMAEVDIHEASLEKVRLGLPAIITVDALPGKTFFGSVGRIAPLPDPQSMWMNPDLKVYNSEVYLEGDTPDLRTGMSCKVEIIVQQYEEAVYIPIQAVIRIAGQPAVYVVKDGTIEEREVKIGLDNNRMIRIIDGIQEGEVVLLTPPLKSASIDEASGMINSGRAESSGELDALKQRINEQLNGTNGTQTGISDTPLDMEERRKMQQQLLGAGKEQEESQKQGRDVRPQGTERNR
ncbi:MAG: efflux RND transporter periplasmic adaptor subunit [Planctomycetes bacterium]|nr:efflux RND transporter periplasmic adaptor subunit [Planctomycetota bacterium]